MKRIAAILLLLLFSCSEKKQSLPELLETWQGKVVSFPTNPVFTRYEKIPLISISIRLPILYCFMSILIVVWIAN